MKRITDAARLVGYGRPIPAMAFVADDRSNIPAAPPSRRDRQIYSAGFCVGRRAASRLMPWNESHASFAAFGAAPQRNYLRTPDDHRIGTFRQFERRPILGCKTLSDLSNTALHAETSAQRKYQGLAFAQFLIRLNFQLWSSCLSRLAEAGRQLLMSSLSTECASESKR